VPPLAVMFKTVSSDCNLDCGYCYYRESLYGGRGGALGRHQVSVGLLEHFIPEYMAYVADSGVASFAWQGGEPMLAGLAFFERAVALQARHARPPMTIANSLQTNATLVDDDWAAFLRRYDFLVGVSLDGPREVHDAVRLDARGRGSYDRVLAGVRRLMAAGVAVNALAVVGPHNVGDPAGLLRFYRDEGFGYVQFIPCMDFQGDDPHRPPAYTVTPRQYGEFLVGLFDAWYHDGLPLISVRLFDNFLQSYLGVPNELCVNGERCGSALIVEYSGDAFPCDFYVNADWRLGNVLERPLREIVADPRRLAFARAKLDLPVTCRECRWVGLCRGGCPRNRPGAAGGSTTPDVLCESYRMLLEHADSRFRALRDRLAARQRYLGVISRPNGPRPNRNDRCPCGSGRKLRQCCGDPVAERSYLFRAGDAPT
jgi:uncharacterized protein